MFGMYKNLYLKAVLLITFVRLNQHQTNERERETILRKNYNT